MSETWIVNASPVIALAKAGYIEVLTQLNREVVLPQPVVDEIIAGYSEDPARKLIESGWGARVVPRQIAPELMEWALGPGETSVLALALEHAPAVAVLDDAAARNCAKVIGVPVIGTLGVIIRAKNHGVLTSAAEAMTALRNAGLYLDDHTIRRALHSVGEVWKPV